MQLTISSCLQGQQPGTRGEIGQFLGCKAEVIEAHAKDGNAPKASISKAGAAVLDAAIDSVRLGSPVIVLMRP